MTEPAAGTAPARSVEIVNKKGLHARAAAKLAKLAVTFDADIQISKDGMSVSARSIMGLMMLAASVGTAVEISVTGSDAAAALVAVVALVESGFGE